MTDHRWNWKGGKKAGLARKKAAGICVDCTNETNGCVKCDACRQREKAGHKKRHSKLKNEVFAAYGGYHCNCPGCGETRPNFLHIDHVDNNGAEHRRQMGDPTGANFYSWLKQHGFPLGFQVLCANCNWAKGRYGKCPHVDEVEKIAKIPLHY
jgi:hypothetical protein